MATALVSGLFGVGALSGALLCVLGLYCYWRWDEPGVVPFAVFTVLIGVGGLAGGVSALVFDPDPATRTPLWADFAYVLWLISTVPWLLFSLQYTGTYSRVRRRTVALISVPVGVLALIIVSQEQGWIGDGPLVGIAGVFASVHMFFLVIIGVYLVLRTTYEYGHLSLVQGVSLGTAGVGNFLTVNVALILLDNEIGMATVAAVYVTGFAVPAGLIAYTIFGQDMFDSTPAAGTIGERAIARETDDLVFVVDQSDRVIKLNPKAAELLDVNPTEKLGEPIEELLSVPLDQLAAMETYELRTGVSRRQFDPTVSTFTDQHDRQLGYILTLHDVTERELRKQRLEVLNRVLRHNLRNSVDVIKSNAEALIDDEGAVPADEHADTIIDSADGLAHLGRKARSIDRFVSRSVRDTERDLTTVVDDLIEAVSNAKTNGSGPDVAVEFERPESALLLTDWEALTAALESAIENAVEHADETVSISITEYATGYRITVTDDGPGIPDSELESLESGRETPLQHGSGLGLWQIKWGIKKLNGTVSFETDAGTTVEMTVPDQATS